MSLNFTFTLTVGGVAITFDCDAANATEALATISTLTGTTAATGKATTAKNTTADKQAAAAPTPDAKTPTASDSSASSSPATNDNAGINDAAKNANAVTDAPALDYDKNVKPLVLAIAKKSQEFAKALLQRHGAIDPKTGLPSAKVLTPAQYPAFVADAQAVIDGTLDPTASADADGAMA